MLNDVIYWVNELWVNLTNKRVFTQYYYYLNLPSVFKVNFLIHF